MHMHRFLCHAHAQVSLYGKGNVGVDRFDEAGYVALPPCLWGGEEEGLQPPVYLKPNTPMYSVQRTANTHVGHTGQMASWQMRGVPFEVKPTPARPQPQPKAPHLKAPQPEAPRGKAPQVVEA